MKNNTPVKTITLCTTAGHPITLSAVDIGEWHPRTATSDAWGFLAVRLQINAFQSKTFRHRILGKAVLAMLDRIDATAPEIEGTVSALLSFVRQQISALRDSAHAA